MRELSVPEFVCVCVDSEDKCARMDGGSSEVNTAD